MKFYICIVASSSSKKVIQELINKDCLVTRISSTGGFLKKGNVSFMFGTDRFDSIDALKCILKPYQPVTVFVLNVERFLQV